MNFGTFFAGRYLFSKKNLRAINLISFISMMGVAVATLALVCILSGLNGFKDLIGSLFTAFDPDLKVVAAKGKSFAMDDARIRQAATADFVEAASFSTEDHALILFRGRPTVITLKGVDDNFRRVSGIDSLLVGDGDFTLRRASLYYGVPSVGLAEQLGGTDFRNLEICVPQKGEHINLANPADNINYVEMNGTGVYFEVHQQKYDAGYMLCDLALADSLYEKPGTATQLELRLKAGASESASQKKLQQLLGQDYRVLNAFQQHEDTYSVMEIEKLFAYGFLVFIALLACLSLVGALTLQILHKRSDLSTLRTLGAGEGQLRGIFVRMALLITLIGTLIGLALGLLLCFVQDRFGLLRLGNDASNFIVQSYPISVHAGDILLIFITMMVLGFLITYWPLRRTINSRDK